MQRTFHALETTEFSKCLKWQAKKTKLNERASYLKAAFETAPRAEKTSMLFDNEHLLAICTNQMAAIRSDGRAG